MQPSLDEQELFIQLSAIVKLLTESGISKGEVTVACAEIIVKDRYDVREEKVKQAVGIISTFKCKGMPLTVAAAAIMQGT